MIACNAFCAGAARRVRLRSRVALLVLAVVATGFPAAAAAEQASQPGSPAAAQIDASGGTDADPSGHTCAVTENGEVRCWGYGVGGRLGYGNVQTIGDDETPGAAGAVQLAGSAMAISAGAFHTCGLLDGGGVRCWGFGGEGRLGYGNVQSIGDDEFPGSVGPVALGGSAMAISAGGGHSCAVLAGGEVRCWGFGGDGRLGYPVHPDGPNRLPEDIGDDETPGSVGPVDLGGGRTATAISSGRDHTCALLDGGDVRCWGFGFLGRLGYASERTIGDDEAPGSVGPVVLGLSATAISAGNGHSCALLVDGGVRCWGFGGNGRLGYGNQDTVGDDETPASAGPVVLGGRAVAISAGDAHSCALLVDGSVRCWGFGGSGRLGYANTNDVGDDETPGSVGPVDVGVGRSAVAISAGGRHTCARLDDGSVRCWGYGFAGRLGYCDEQDVGDDESPGSVEPVNWSTAVCPAATPPAAPPPPPPGPPAPAPAPSVPPAPVAEGPLTAKLSLARARIVRRDRVLDVLAPISGLASGSVRVQLHAAGLLHSFDALINQRDARVRFRKLIPRAQALLGTGILTITYRGDADTRPQTMRLRAASQPARLRLSRPTISNGRLRAAGSVSKRARGVVRVQIEYVVAGRSYSREFKARIADGRWSLDQRLSQTVRTAIGQRTGSVHSYTLFTGYMPRRVRGEMRSFQVLGPR